MRGALRAFVALTLTVGGLAFVPATAVHADDPLPVLTVGQTSVIEGDAGTAVVNVSVDLSAPSLQTVTVFATIGGGTASPGTDFFAPTRPTKVTFKAGIATKNVSVKVYGDQAAESDETVPVTLSAPVNAVIGDGGAGVVTILDDDSDAAVGLQASIGEVTIVEANGGTHYAYVPITLSRPAPAAVKVQYVVSCGSADDGMDSYKVKGTVSFAMGTQTKQVKFVIGADMTPEDARTIIEHIAVLTGPATVTDSHGGATVLDNDGGDNGPPVGSIQRVSIASDGSEAVMPDARLCGGAGGGSGSPAVSGDGRYVAFASYAVNLSPYAANTGLNIFVHDRVSGATRQVNLTGAGDPPSGPQLSNQPEISADGRYVTFKSSAVLAPGAASHDNLYRHDMVTGATEVVDIGIGGAPADDRGPGAAEMSADGRYVVFESAATNLVTNDADPPIGNGHSPYDVFIRDMETGTTTLVSAPPDGSAASGGAPQISPDGHYVAFESADSSYVPGDTNGCYDLFVRDMVTGTFTRETVSSSGSQMLPAGDECPLLSFGHALSNDGRYVAFSSTAWNLTGGATTPPQYLPFEHLYLRDRVAGTTEMIGDTSPGATNLQSSISGDGHSVAYTNLDNEQSDSWQVFVYDTATGDDELAGVLPDGTVGDGDNLTGWSTAISIDGHYLAFESDSTNLVDDDLNGVSDVFEQRLS